jgi:hypothetical protein
MTRTKQAIDLPALLAELGSTPAVIANSLRAAGCQGVRSDPCRCPVSVWLGRRTGVEAVRFSVHHNAVIFQGEFHWLPTAVQEFVGLYDRGLYPSLVARQDGGAA